LTGGLFHGPKSMTNSETLPTTATMAAIVIGTLDSGLA
jgi:hypothetical protein